MTPPLLFLFFIFFRAFDSSPACLACSACSCMRDACVTPPLLCRACSACATKQRRSHELHAAGACATAPETLSASYTYHNVFFFNLFSLCRLVTPRVLPRMQRMWLHGAGACGTATVRCIPIITCFLLRHCDAVRMHMRCTYASNVDI